MSTDFQFRLQHAIDASFLIDRELGGGGMSRVFVATERALQRRVVIKVLPPELSAGVNVERFRREIQLAAQLQHPHIVPLLATGDEDGILWFSMPFIEGESLRGALNKEKRLPARDVVRILHDVVDALAYAHARGIVHRDIKPDNILTSGMHALVTDFGVAKALSAAIPMAGGGTSTGMAIGTPAYMAPEQLAADPAADHRVDIYAVGLLAYELLTGRSPFGGSSPQATMAAQLTETPKPPHQFADIPEGLSTVIMHCLEKDAGKRPQSAQALLADLDALPPMSSGTSAATARPARRQWQRVAGVAAALAMTFLVAQQILTPKGGSTVDSLTARDIGPGGDRAKSMPVDPNSAAAPPRVIRAKPETVVVYRNATDSASGIQVPVVISRAESLAITAAVRRRIADAEAAKSGAIPSSAPARGAGAAVSSQTGVLEGRDMLMVPLDREQLYAEVGKLFADSVAHVFHRIDSAMAKASLVYRFESARPTGRAVTPMLAPPSDGRTRVVVSNFTNATAKREYASVGGDIAQRLRRDLASDKVEVVDRETTDRASRGFGDPTSLGFGLRADYVVNGMITQRADSVVVITMFYDVRDGRFSRVTEVAAAPDRSLRTIEPPLGQLTAWIDSANTLRARRRQTPESNSGARRGGPPQLELGPGGRRSAPPPPP